ncbi:MAG: endonuclease/exonuclease/phosphatase family protein [Gammaproteobacteria bacterium]|nr:endonuclease/exonuclease/phosphatase family protein [Gammaproteobacteria bacterium]
MSYNVYFDDSTGETRYPKIISYIQSENLDVIALQEVTPRFYQYIKDSTLEKKYTITPKTPSGSYFNLILSKTLPTTSGVFDFQSFMGRAAVYSDIVHNGTTIRVINVHLESLDSRSSRYLRQKQIKSLKTLLHKNTILLGDFNFSIDGPYYYKPPYKLNDAATLTPFINHPTYDVKKNKLAMATAGYGEKSRRLDRLYITSSLSLFDYKVTPIPFSDHYPVEIKVGSNRKLKSK